jgi:hypothetical protein
MADRAWNLAGNAKNTADDFLGTTDSQPLVIKTAGSEQLRVDTAGNVGVGTSSPGYPVHLGVGKVLRIEGGTGPDDTTDYFSFGGNGSFGIDAPGYPDGRFVVQNDGQVRIGAGTGGGSLGVDSFVQNNGDESTPNGLFVASGALGGVGIGNPTPSYHLHLGSGAILRIEGGEATFDDTVYFSIGGTGAFGIDAPYIPNGRFIVDNSGNVGIGTPSPSYGVHLATGKALRIEGGTSGTDDASYFSFGGNGAFGIDAPGVPNGRFVVDNSGNVGIGIASPASILHVAGDVTVTGDVLLTGADCAEQFDAGDGQELEPGTVVVIDGTGGLKESRQAYDKKVAGVVSGGGSYRTALVLDKHQSDEPRITVALVGKVYCQADARQSPIEVGDLLTTSATPGHAMKATEPLRAFGAVIGKALEPLARGQGLIPILVALQ